MTAAARPDVNAVGCPAHAKAKRERQDRLVLP